MDLPLNINEHSGLCIRMRSSSARYSADPDGLDAQSDLIGAPEPVSIEAVLAAPNGGCAHGY